MLCGDGAGPTSKDHAVARDRCRHFQNGVTLKKEELMWRKVAEDVNTEDGIGHGHAAIQVKKAWKNVKRAILEKQRKSTATTGIEGEGHS